MTSGRSQPDLKPRPMDALVVLSVVLFAAIIAVLVYGKSESESLTATVKHRGETVPQVVLDTLQEEKTVTIDGKYHLTVTVTRDGVSVTESDCPGQDCVHTGRITKAGQSIVCLPEQVIVTMEGSSPSPDVILLVAMSAGNASALLFSLMGGVLAMLTMIVLRRVRGLSVYGVSIAGAAAHNIGQICAAMVVLGGTAVLGYLPVLLGVSLITGTLTGFVASLLFRAMRGIYFTQ